MLMGTNERINKGKLGEIVSSMESVFAAEDLCAENYQTERDPLRDTIQTTGCSS